MAEIRKERERNDEIPGGDIPPRIFGALGFDHGDFQFRIFGRYQTLGPTWFWTLGVGMTFPFRWEAFFPEGSPWDRQGP